MTVRNRRLLYVILGNFRRPNGMLVGIHGRSYIGICRSVCIQ